jgi:hypothetical protein
MYLDLSVAPDYHRPLPCVCTVVPCLEIILLHSRLLLFFSAHYRMASLKGHSDIILGKQPQRGQQQPYSGIERLTDLGVPESEDRERIRVA